MSKKNRLGVGFVAAIVLLACACSSTGLPAINEPTVTDVPYIPTQTEIPTSTPQPSKVL